MKQKIIRLPVLCVLVVSIVLSGCATKKDLSELYITGAVIGVAALIALLLPDGEDSNPEEQLNTEMGSSQASEYNGQLCSALKTKPTGYDFF